MIIENRRRVEAKLCLIKYFKAASEAIIFLVSLIRGIIESKLISKPIHIPIHEYEEIVIKVPVIVVDINMIL